MRLKITTVLFLSQLFLFHIEIKSQKPLLGIDVGTSFSPIFLRNNKNWGKFSQVQRFGFQLGFNTLLPSKNATLTKVGITYFYSELDYKYLKQEEHFEKEYKSFNNGVRFSFSNNFLIRKFLFFNLGGVLSYNSVKSQTRGLDYFASTVYDSNGKQYFIKTVQFYEENRKDNYLDAFLLLGFSGKIIDKANFMMFIESNVNFGFYSQTKMWTLIPHFSLSLYKKM